MEVETKDNQCSWDNEGSCVECRKSKCPECKDGENCTMCILTNTEQLCFAYCEKPADPLNVLSFEQWLEIYPSVRCLRNRSLFQSGKFVGFCSQHNRAFPIVNDCWKSLSLPEKEVLNYLIDTKQCAVLQFDKFISSKPEYLNMSVEGLLKLIFSPMGIMTCEPIYFFTLLTMVTNVYVQTAAKQQLDSYLQGSLDNISPEQFDEHMQNFVNQAIDYKFVLQAILNNRTIEWLMHEDETVRHMNWNMLLHKTTIMFMYCVPSNSQPLLPLISANWEMVWNEELQRTGKQQDPMFNVMWEKFTNELRGVFVIFNNTACENSSKPQMPAEELDQLRKTCDGS